jgi:hypothetical protein
MECVSTTIQGNPRERTTGNARNSKRQSLISRADMVSIGVLILTATGILAILDALQKKGVTGQAGTHSIEHSERATRHGRCGFKAR